MINLKEISKTFSPGTANQTTALKNISLKINAREFVVLVGSNGSGKSTLLNVMSGTTSVDHGDIYFDGVKVNHLKEHQRSKWIARVFQDPRAGTASGLSVLDNFRLAALRTQKKKLQIGTNKKFSETVKEKISMLGLGLENKTNQLMGTLSGGQRQALTLVMAVMDEARILLMDEPAAALDPKTADLLMKQADGIIKNFNLTCILITHSMKDAHAYGQRLLLMQDGRITKDLNENEKQSLTINEMYGWF
jgi:putative ABC transport system ATP-binding protein